MSFATFPPSLPNVAKDTNEPQNGAHAASWSVSPVWLGDGIWRNMTPRLGPGTEKLLAASSPKTDPQRLLKTERACQRLKDMAAAAQKLLKKLCLDVQTARGRWSWHGASFKSTLRVAQLCMCKLRQVLQAKATGCIKKGRRLRPQLRRKPQAFKSRAPVSANFLNA